MKGKIVLDDESLTVTASRFVEYLKEVKCKCGVKPILVGSDSEKSFPQSQNRIPDETDFKDTFKETLQFIYKNLKRKEGFMNSSNNNCGCIKRKLQKG